MLFSKLTEAEERVLNEISVLLQVLPDWLYKLIDFESGWNALARNPISSARGLLQFTDTTARRLFLMDDADRIVEAFPDRISQLRGPVYQYLKDFSPFPSQQSLAMAVFYPKYRDVPADTLFPDSVLAVNPGIKTPADYLRKVYKDWTLPGAALVLVALGFIFLISQKG